MEFSEKITKWYKHNQRDLPWRKTTDPYYIWLSEVILQQTRVKQGLPYYKKFVTHFPNIQNLANAKEDTVMKLWQGLGYYNRARNMHATAKHISNKFNGEFPNTYDEIIQLKGIGEYTAAAISSFCYNEPKAVVDGNVYRLLSRYFGIFTPINSSNGKNEFTTLANNLLNKNNPGIHNQAIMEFGALMCKPISPDCLLCPLKNSCVSNNENLVKALPVKTKKIKSKKRYFNYLVITDGKEIYIQQRLEKDIWEKLYQFPNIETSKEVGTIPDYYQLINLDRLILKNNHQFKQILSHQIIYAKFWLLYSEIQLEDLTQFKLTPLNNLNSYPVPKVVENYILHYPELFNSKSYL